MGDRWDYQDLNSGQIFTLILTRDSIGTDGSHNLFYNNSLDPAYRIDTLNNVFWAPEQPYGNWLLYKLAADSGEAWCYDPPVPPCNWAYVHRVDSMVVFGRRTVVKTFCYDPGPPGGGGWCWFADRWLASGFGLIYEWNEPFYISWLRGCVIAGDTFGTLVSVPIEEPMLPADFKLYQNYPNPFNPKTTLEFALPIESSVRLTIYDILGREIEVIVDDKKMAGKYAVVFNGSNLSSGLYIAKLRVNEKTITRKMSLMK